MHRLIRRRFEGDEDLLRELAVVFLEDYPARLAAIGDALRRRDAAALGRAAHTLKGAVSVLCDNGPTPMVRDLEAAARTGSFTEADAIYGELGGEMERLRLDLTALVASAAPSPETV